MKVTLNTIRDRRSLWDCAKKRFTNGNGRSTLYGVEVTIENGKTTRTARGMYDTASRYRGRLLYHGTDRYVTSPKIIEAIRDCIDGELAIRWVGYLDGSEKQLVDAIGEALQAHEQTMEMLKARQSGGAS